MAWCQMIAISSDCSLHLSHSCFGTLAEGVEYLYTPGLWVPLVVIQQTYILPGIPRLFQQMVEAHAERFKGPAAHTSVRYSNMGEGEGARKQVTVHASASKSNWPSNCRCHS